MDSLNYEVFEGEVWLSTQEKNAEGEEENHAFGFIRYTPGIGHCLHVNEDRYSKAFYASQNEHGCFPAWKKLDACKYFALALYMEHGVK